MVGDFRVKRRSYEKETFPGVTILDPEQPPFGARSRLFTQNVHPAGESYFWHEAIYHFRHRYASVVADELMIIGRFFGEIMEIALPRGMENTNYDLFEFSRRPTAESILHVML